MADEKDEQERRRKAERDLSEHDRMTERSAAHASRDTLHDASSWQEAGAYTVQEARDRAAHTPSILEKLERPRTPQEQDKMLAELDRELFPTESEREAYDRETSLKQPPANPEERQQWEDLQQMYGAGKPGTGKESKDDMTPEQQASVDKALSRANINDQVGGASDVSGRPAPNDPTPIEKARDIGQDLQKQGVTMEK